jgi:KDO2-lipid IV(A) lauroyltransferase
MASLTALAYAAGFGVVRALPRRATWPLFAAGADLAVRRRGKGTSRLAANLRRVVGPELGEAEFEALLRRAMRSYARYWQDAFRLPSLSREQLRRGFDLDGEDILRENVAAGVGTIVALPHAGNWDAAGAWVAAHGWPITTVAERLRPEEVYERFLAFRRGLGMEILPLTGGDRAVIAVLEERVRAGAVVPLLADRDLSARGIEVEFFGGRARMPAGPAILAVRTGAPFYGTEMWYDGDFPRARLHGPLTVPAEGTFSAKVRQLTQQLADVLQAGIAAHPADWHMLQRLWLDEPAVVAP